MNTLNLVIAMSSLIGALAFVWLGCHLTDEGHRYSQRAKMRLARALAVVGVITIVGFAYTVIPMSCDGVDGQQRVAGLLGSTFGTFLISGIGYFLFSQIALPILRPSKNVVL